VDVEEDLDLTPQGFGEAARLPLPNGPVPDLAGMPKVWFLRARERSGKTLLARWLAELVLGRGGEMLVAALDQVGRRRLLDFVEGVEQPPTKDPAGVSRWLEALVRHCMEEKASALVDTGGGDLSLPGLLAKVPDLSGVMREAGVACVGCYVVGGDPLDLGVLAADVAAGFRPETLIVLNHGLVDPTVPAPDAFRRVLGHPAYKDAVKAGAQVVEMPRMNPDTMAEVDRRRLHFGDARDRLDPFMRYGVRVWGEAMAASFDRVRTWVPG
jgi:hypothetical protein